MPWNAPNIRWKITPTRKIGPPVTELSRPPSPIHAATMPAGTWPAIVGGFAVLTALCAALTAGTGLGGTAVGAAIATYLVVGTVVLATIGHSHAAADFGLPNLVTLARVLATALVAGYATEVLAGFDPSSRLATAFAALAGATILADGLDGWLARSRGPETAFGARFDMEIDALMLLALAGLAHGLGKVGAWVILIGAMRYLFVAAGLAWRWLEAPLPPSFRRKAVCVLQGAALTALALPMVGGSTATALAAVALAALSWSFALDTIWLAARRTRR